MVHKKHSKKRSRKGPKKCPRKGSRKCPKKGSKKRFGRRFGTMDDHRVMYSPNVYNVSYHDGILMADNAFEDMNDPMNRALDAA